MPELKSLPAQSEWLRASFVDRPIGVDRKARALRGYVVAQKGYFKSDGRGQFTDESLQKILSLWTSAGLKSRFAHPTLSEDGIGKFLGRAKSPVLDGGKVRADLYFDDSAFDTPSGDLATYVMDLAESDPEALSSSLVLQTDKVMILDEQGRPKKDETGNDIPPIWIPTKLHASDIVDTGDAVDGLLSPESLPDALVRRGAELLDKAFVGQSREVVEARCLSWLSKYLGHRFGEEQRHGHGWPSVLAKKIKLVERGF